MKKHIHVAMLGLIVLIVGVVAACGSGGNLITSEDYGSAWPFTVSEVELRCEGDSDIAAVWVEHDDKRYPLTGYSDTYLRSRYRNVRALDWIWRDNPATGAKVSIGPITRDGEAMCGSGGSPRATATPRPTSTPHIASISAEEYRQTTIRLFNELLSMVEDGVVSPLVPDLGFNKGNPRANRWRQNVETLRDSAGTGADGLLFSERCFEFSDTLGDDVCGDELLTFVNLIVFDKWDEYQKLAEKFSRIAEEQ